MRELDGSGPSSAPPLKAPEIRARTLEQGRQDAIAETQRHVNFANRRLEEVKRAHDPRVWEANRARLGRSTKAEWMKDEDLWTTDFMNMRDDRLEVFGTCRRGRRRRSSTPSAW